MTESSVTAKGQTTVPRQVRNALGVSPGTRLVWHLMPDGAVMVRAKSKSVLELAAVLKAPKGRRVSIADMNAWR